MTLNFRAFLILVVTLSALVWAFNAGADEIRFTPYLSLGAYHLDCAMTDEMICNNDKMGSDTPGTIDLGIRIEPNRPRLWLLFADEIDVGWHHQSYVDRGYIIPGVVDLGGQEAQMDMYGVRFTWEIQFLSFEVGL